MKAGRKSHEIPATPVPTMHSGGTVPHSGLFDLEKGEQVIPAQETVTPMGVQGEHVMAPSEAPQIAPGTEQRDFHVPESSHARVPKESASSTPNSGHVREAHPTRQAHEFTGGNPEQVKQGHWTSDSEGSPVWNQHDAIQDGEE